MADKIDQLFGDLQSRDFAKDKTNQEFRDYMLAPGKQGYENRKQFFEDFKSQGLTDLETYEDFASLIGLRAASAGRKPAPQQPQTPQRTVPQGFGQLDTNQAKRMGAGNGPVAWEEPEANDEETFEDETRRVVNENITPEEQKRVQKRMQQRLDEIDYEVETGKRLRQPVLNPDFETPTVARDEYGNVRRDANGNVMTGYTTDEDVNKEHREIMEEQAEYDSLSDEQKREYEKQAKLRAEQVDYEEPTLWDTIKKDLGSGLIRKGAEFLDFMQQMTGGMIVEDPSSPTGYTKLPTYEEAVNDKNNPITRLSDYANDTADRWNREAQPLEGKGFLDMLWDGEIGAMLQKGVGTALESMPNTLSAFNPITMIANGILMASGNYRDQVLENPDIPEWKRASMAIGMAAIEQLTEKYSDPFFKYVGGSRLFRSLGKEATEEAVSNITKEATENIAKRIFGRLAGVGKDALGEGAEEIISNFGSDTLGELLDLADGDKNYGIRAQWAELKKNNPDADLWTFAMDKAKEYMEAGIGGGMAGAYMSGTTQVSMKALEYAVGKLASKEQIAQNPNTRIDPTTLDMAQSYDEGYTADNADIQKQYVDEAATAGANLSQYGEEFAKMVTESQSPVETLDYLMNNRDYFTDEQIEAAADFLQKKAAAEGVMEGTLDRIDQTVEQSNAEVISNTHQATGQVITAQIGDGAYYIIGGDVAIDEDTGMPVVTGTGGAVVVKDPMTGEVSVKPANNTVITSMTNADEMIQYNEEVLRQQLMQQADDDITFGSPASEVYDLDDTVTLQDGEGGMIEGQVVTLPNAVDGVFVIQTNDGKALQMTADDMNRRIVAHNGMEVQRESTMSPGSDQVSDQVTKGQINGQTIPSETPAAEVQQPVSQQNEKGEKAEPQQSALSRIPVRTDKEGQPLKNKKGRPILDWHKASVEDAAAALVETTGGNMVMARDTASDLVKNEQTRLEKIRKQKPTGDDPIEIAESRMEIQKQVDEVQAIVKQWQDVGNHLRKQIEAEAAEKRAAEEAAKSEEQRQREAEEARIRKEKQDAIAAERRRKQIEEEVANWNKPYAPLAKARKEMENDREAMGILDRTEPESLEEWISSLIQPQSMMWDDETDPVTGRTVIGLQSELGLQKKDIERIGGLVAPRSKGGRPFGQVVHDIWEALPEGMKQMYDDQDVRNALIGLFGEGNAMRMRHLTEEHRIEEARQLLKENARRDAEAEMDAWAEFYHLNPEERETFEDFIKVPPTPVESDIINQIIADNEQNRRSEKMDLQPVSGSDAAGIEGGEGQVRQAAEAAGNGNPEQGTAKAPETAPGEPPAADNNVPGGESIFVTPVLNVSLSLQLVNDLAEAYASGDPSAIQSAVVAMKAYVDEGGDFENKENDSIYDYDGNDPQKLALQYKTHLLLDTYLEDDEDQEYIKTGLKPEMRQSPTSPDEQFTQSKLGVYPAQTDSLPSLNSEEEAGNSLESTPQSIGKTSTPEEIQAEEAKVDINPTEGQKEAGNYQKGHIKVHGLDISIENPKGSIRSGVDQNGKEWRQEMNNSYGYIRRTEAVDGDHVDVFLSDDPAHTDKVFIVQQRKKVNGEWKFDELKVLLGFDSATQGANAYLSNYEKGWEGMDALIETDIESFKDWLKNGNQKGAYKEDGAWTKVYPGVSDMVADEREMPEPEQQEVQVLRGEGNNSLPGMGGELPEVPGGRGQEAAPQSDTGQNRREQGLLQGELQVDGLDNPVSEQTDSPLSDLQGSNDVNAPVGRENGASAEKNKVQDTELPLERGENAGDSGRDQSQLQNDNIPGQNNENGGLGEGVQHELQNAEEQAKTGLDNGENSNDTNKLKQEGKIEDVGEEIAGARKDMTRKIAQSLDSATKQTLAELPFSKAYKKPDLKKAVEEGALRESDATFYDAFFSTFIDPNKPRVTQAETRRKKYIPDFRTNLEKWVDRTHQMLQTLKEFVEADEQQRDRMIESMLADKYPFRDSELADIEKRKEWNKEKKDIVWGDMTTPNPLWITYEVMKQMDYSPGDKVDIPYGILKSNSTGTGYSIRNKKDELMGYSFPKTVEEGIDAIVWLAKMKRGDTDIQHPVDSFYSVPTKSQTAENGRYRVVYGSWRSPQSREFDSKEEADAFAAKKPGAQTVALREVVRRFGYKPMFRHPLTGERIAVNDREFDTEAEARQYIEENYEELNNDLNTQLSSQQKESSGKKELTADDLLYTALVRGKEGRYGYAVLIDKKYANNYGMPLILKEGFASRDDAKAYADGVKNQVLKVYKDYKARQKAFTYFDTGEDSRIGEDYRNGKDVTADDFMNAFGFRGVQFGNWTNQRDRQMAVNQAYDALLDLAKLIGVSPRALSLNGELGIAFGARGSGNASAHYEPGEIVINLTKTKGAGSLAHEWWHALDNYFARTAGEKGGMVTDDRTLPMRKELRDAYNTLVDQLKESNYYTRSKNKGDYWGRMHEVTARLLSEWVDQQLKKRGELNTFLSRGAKTDGTMEMNYERYKAHAELAGKEVMPFEEYKKLDEAMSGSPYPSAQEVERFSAAMQNIFDVMQEREDEETGRVALYHKVDDSQAEAPKAEPGSQDTTLRDAIVELLQDAGIDVITDDAEGQRTLDEANGKVSQSKVYHGSGAEFDAFDHSHMGEGEGIQAFGWGTYVTTSKGIGRNYAKQIGGRGNLYKGYDYDDLVVMDDEVNGEAVFVVSIMDNKGYNASKAIDLLRKTIQNDIEKTKNGKKHLSGKDQFYIDSQKERLSELNLINPKDFTEKKDIGRYLYDVEIPNENEAYYLDYKGKMSDQKDVLDMVDNALTADGWKRQEIDSRIKFTKDDNQIILTPNQSGGDLYAELQEALGSDKAASEFLHNVGITGIKYPAGTISGGGNGATNYVIFNENDARITGTTKFFRTKDGQAYGYTYNGKIYLDPSIATAETPVHEYTHLWAEAVRQKDPKTWENIVDVLKNDPAVRPFWEKVAAQYPELTDENDIAEEVLAQYSGRRGSEKLREVADEIARENGGIFGKAQAVEALRKMRNILARFWKAVADVMGWQYSRADEIADKVLYDLLSGVNPTDPTGVPKDTESLKDYVLSEFNRAKEGNAPGERIPFGKLTEEGRKYLEHISGMTMKPDVSFILNASELRHIYNDHYGDNEKDKGNNIPLTDGDIRALVDVVTSPDKVVFAVENKTGRKLFFFLKNAGNGTYNLAEVYADSRGNLTTKSFYKTKKSIAQRANELLKDPKLSTSETDGESSFSGANIPKLFETSKDLPEKVQGNGIKQQKADTSEAENNGPIRQGESIFDYARRVMGRRTETRPEPEDTDDIAKRIYDETLAREIIQRQERWQDSMVSLNAIQDAIAAETGKKATAAEDAYRFENRMHGRAKNMSEMYDWRYYQPMLKAFNDFINANGMTQEQGLDYLISKSGLERNVYYAFRDGARAKLADDIEKMRDKLEKDYAKGLMDEGDYILKKEELEELQRTGVDDIIRQTRETLAYQRAKEDYRNGTIGYTEYLRRIEGVIRGQVGNYYDTYAKDYSGLTETFAKEMYDEAQTVKKAAQRTVDPKTNRELWREYDEKMQQAYMVARQVAEDSVFAAETGKGDHNGLWGKINAATKETLKHSYESGLMDRNTYNKVREMFDYYIPLRGWDDDKASDVYTYMGKDNVFSPAVKKTWGRKSQADNPLAYIGNIAVSTILSGHRNQMKQHFLNYVMNNPTSLVSVSESWYENIGNEGDSPVWILRTADTAGKSPDEIVQIVNDFNEEMRLKQREGKAMPVTGRLRLDVHATSGQKAEHVVEVQRAGHTYQLYINGNPKAAQALNGMLGKAARLRDIPHVGKFISGMNHSMAAFFTSKNPAFVISNLSRDLNMAGASVAIKENKEYNAKFIANVAKVLAPRLGESSKWVPSKLQPTGLMPSLMRKYKNGTLDMSDETQRYFKEFMDEGGETGFVNMLSVDSFKEKLEKEISQMNGSDFFGRGVKETTIKKGLRLMGETFEFYNRCAEDATRFIVYMTSRQTGKGLEDSIADAKDVTLNFNRKGTGEGWVGLIQDLFIFVNPAIQALANMYSMMKKKPLRFGAVTGAFVAGGVLMPVINQWLMNMFGDDDDKDAYWNLPPWVRKNNLVFWIPFTDNFLTIPLAQEFRVFYGIGEMIGSYVYDHPHHNAGLEVAESLADLIPINPIGNGGNLIIDLAPTLTQPVLQIAFNTDFTGKPIWRDNQSNKFHPVASKAYVSTPKAMVKISEGINSATGGDEDMRGWLERTKAGSYLNNPAIWNHLLQGYFGGMYNTISKAIDTAGSLAQGELPEIYRVPVVNRFLNRPSEREASTTLGEDYWELIDDNDEFQNVLRKRKEKANAGDEEAKEKLERMMQSEDYHRSLVISSYEKMIDEARKIEKASEGEKEKEYRQITLDLKEAMMEDLDAIDGGNDPVELAMKKFDESEDPRRRKAMASRISKEAGASKDPYGDKPNSDHAYQYQVQRNGDDVWEDALLYAHQEKLKKKGDDRGKEDLSKERKQVHANTVYLHGGRSDSIWMNSIRKQRGKLLDKYGLKKKSKKDD